MLLVALIMADFIGAVDPWFAAEDAVSACNGQVEWAECQTYVIIRGDALMMAFLESTP